MIDKETIKELNALGLDADFLVKLIVEPRPEVCSKPNCNCIEIAEKINGGNPVKNYECRAKISDIEQEKTSANKGDGWINPLPFIS